MRKTLHRVKHKARKHLRLKESHKYFYENWSWYKWWHEQDYHRHVHYAAMIAGVVAAGYYVMIDSIMKEVRF